MDTDQIFVVIETLFFIASEDIMSRRLDQNCTMNVTGMVLESLWLINNQKNDLSRKKNEEDFASFATRQLTGSLPNDNFWPSRRCW